LFQIATEQEEVPISMPSLDRQLGCRDGRGIEGVTDSYDGFLGRWIGDGVGGVGRSRSGLFARARGDKRERSFTGRHDVKRMRFC
jgi:hypothetical protein